MKSRVLITGIAVLFLATGTAHAEARFSILNPKGTAKGNYADDWLCGLNIKLVGDRKLDTNGTCVDKESGEVTLKDDGSLTFGPKPGKCTHDYHITGVERIDRNSYIVYIRCDYKPNNAQIQLLGDTLLITNVEDY
jgi:hypothetical protein